MAPCGEYSSLAHRLFALVSVCWYGMLVVYCDGYLLVAAQVFYCGECLSLAHRWFIVVSVSWYGLLLVHCGEYLSVAAQALRCVERLSVRVLVVHWCVFVGALVVHLW